MIVRRAARWKTAGPKTCYADDVRELVSELTHDDTLSLPNLERLTSAELQYLQWGLSRGVNWRRLVASQQSKK